MSPNDYPIFLQLYSESFPPEERRDYADTADFDAFIESHPAFEVIGVYQQTDFVGFMTIWHFPEFIYCEHAATIASVRGAGIGAAMFKSLFASVGNNVVIEVEPDGSTPMANRRIGFYKRIGFVLRDEIDYMQPPYATDGRWIRLNIMTHGNVNFSPDCSNNPISLIHKVVYNRL